MDIVYYKNKMEAWGPDDHGTIKNLALYKGYKAKYDELLGNKKEDTKVLKNEGMLSDEKFEENLPGIGKLLKDMTKDELNDLAAREFPNTEIKGHWSKKKIISEIEKHY